VTEPEIGRLLLQIVWPQLREVKRALLWSYWRRRHQAVARDCHYKKRTQLNPQL